MFLNMCRACLSNLNDLSDIVPLFEMYQNVYYYRLCNELQLSVDDNNESVRNLCKSCAEEILKSYKFRMMYMESERKLNEMLDSKTKQSLLAIETGSVMESNLESSDVKWNCDQCSACFEKRSMFRQHVKQVHPVSKDDLDEMTRQTEDGLKRWKCTLCSAHFRTRKLKYQHQKEHHESVDPIKTKEVSVIHHEDFDGGSYIDNGDQNIDCHFANTSEDADDDSSYREIKFIQSCVKTEISNDVGVDMDENHLELYSFKKSGLDSEMLGNHSKEETSKVANERWKCKMCLECFPTRKSLQEHNHLHRLQKPELKVKDQAFEKEKVKIANETISFGDAKSGVDEARNNPEFRWKCKKCLSTFKTRYMLTVHRRICVAEPANNSEFRWKCNICLDTFKTRDLLTIHRKIHVNITRPIASKKWHCTFCLVTFSSREAYRIHRKAEHRNVQRKCNQDVYGNDFVFTSFTCEICDKIFPTKVKIRRHMEKHKEENNRLCTICGLIFTSTNGFNRHILLVHRHERNFHCKSCTSRFSSAYRLKMHMNRHEGIRPFACELCEKAFYNKNALYTHRRSIHLDINKFICQICSKACNRIDNLRTHLRKVHQYRQPDIGGSC